MVIHTHSECNHNVTICVDDKKVEEMDKAPNEFFDYKCNNNLTLKKHIKLKHGENKCKICRKEFKVAIELVSHVAIEQ